MKDKSDVWRLKKAVSPPTTSKEETTKTIEI